MLDTVGVELGVGDLEVDDCVDLHRDVILRDDRLGIEVGHLLFEADLLHDALEKRNFEVQAHTPGRAVSAEALNDVGARLLHDLDVRDEHQKHQQH